MTYKPITSIIALVIGILLIIFRNKFVNAQKRRAEGKDDYISKEIVKRPQESAALITSVVGLGFIVVALINLAGIL